MVASERELLRGVDGPAVGRPLGRLEEAETDGGEVSARGLRAVEDRVEVVEARLVEVVLARAARDVQRPGVGEGAVVARRDVAGAVVELAVGGGVVDREGVEGARVRVGGVAEDREINLVARGEVPVELGRVVVRRVLPVELAQRGQARVPRSCHLLPPIAGVEVAVEEQLVLDEGPPEVDTDVEVLLVTQLPHLVDSRVVGLMARRLQAAGLHIAVHRAPELASTRLRDDVHDPALGLAVLRLEAAGLHLHLFDVGAVDAHAQRPVDAGEDTEAAEGGVGDVHAVGHVQVVQRRPAGNGRVGLSTRLALRHARGQVEQVIDPPLDGQVLEDLRVDVGADRGVAGVDVHRPADDLDRLRDVAGAEREPDRRRLADVDGHVAHRRGLEPGQRRLDRILPGDEVGHLVAAPGVGDHDTFADRTRDRDRGPRHHGSRRVHDRPADAALRGNVLGRRGQAHEGQAGQQDQQTNQFVLHQPYRSLKRAC